VDPAVERPADEAVGLIGRASPIPVSSHQPVLKGIGSLTAEKDGIKGIVLLGSLASVHDDFDWMRELWDWLRPLMESGVPILGICFGHQLIAHRLGGKVEYKPLGRIGAVLAPLCLILAPLNLLVDMTQPLRFWHLMTYLPGYVNFQSPITVLNVPFFK